MFSRKITRIFIALLLVAEAGFVANAWSETTVEQLRTSGVKLGAVEEPPYVSYSSDGKLSGAAAELTVAVLAKLGIKKVTPEIVDFGAIIPGIQAHRFDLVSTGLFVKPQRCKAVAFTEPDLCTEEGFAVKKGNPMKILSYQDLLKPNVKIGVCGGCSEEKRALQVGVQRSQLVVVSDAFNGMQQLEAGRIDVLAWPDATLTSTIDKMKVNDLEVVRSLPGEKVSCSAPAFNVQDKDLQSAYNKALAEMKRNGEFDKIVSRYGFNPTLAKAQSTAALCSNSN